MSPSINFSRRSRSATLFLAHAWRTRWGAIGALAGASVLTGLCMVALFITPVGVRELSTLQLLGMAGLFVLPAVTIASLHWERGNRGMAWRVGAAHARVASAEPPAQAPSQASAEVMDDASREVAALAEELDRVLATPWIMPDAASPRGNTPSRHRRRVRPALAGEPRVFLSTGRE